MFGEDRISREPQKIEPEIMQPIIQPQVIQQQTIEQQAMYPQTAVPPARESRTGKFLQGRKTGLGWLILFISILVVVLLGLLAWFFYGDEIKDLLFLNLPGWNLNNILL